MEAIETILTRKSVRQFSDKEIEEEKIETILKAAMASPSAVNRQPWEFYVVKNKEYKEAIKKAMPFGKFDSPIIIIPCVKESATLPINHDLCYCDLSAASENILLAAHALGLGAVWCAIYPGKDRIKAIKKAINIPLGLTPFSAIYIGYPSEEDKSVIKDKYDIKKVRTI
ncbi:MAG: nitroreductase family protein [Bacilli bacterium]|nr:nitroreductase family protein [Bacilli bacterium]